MNAINNYSLPVPKDKLQRIDRMSSPAHVGKLRNAIDFIVAENTSVLAAADGVVIFVKDDSHIGGPSIEYWHGSNFIVIQHPHTNILDMTTLRTEAQSSGQGSISREERLLPGLA